ncbi:MAG: response regulator transcription factor [Dehalococcoidales bacterium]|nr:response regulator transcription factor [Dehalococcoidales bacterium]
MENTRKVLLIEDNIEITETISQIIDLRWPEASLLDTKLGMIGVELAKKEHPDLIILDLGLPDTDGFQVLRQIRRFSDVLLIILTARGEEDNRIRGLQEGADDYIVKPFSAGELVARMKSLIRRREMTETTAAVAKILPDKNNLIIDAASQTASFGSRLLKMGPRQYELLYLLVTNKGVVLSKQELMGKVFPENDESDTRFVEVYIDKLREELGENLDNPKLILNEGTGYKFVGTYTVMRRAAPGSESSTA